jgi:hypothetical protein
MIALTEKQRLVYLAAAHYYAATGEPCSIAWLTRRLKKDRKTIHGHLQAISDKGWADAHTPAFRRLNL